MHRWFGTHHRELNVVLTIPHAGETVPPEAKWLERHETAVLLTDIDRYVDELYEPIAKRAPVPVLTSEVHRYAVDLNRYPADVDWSTVEKTNTPEGAFPTGFHWKKTTTGELLMANPISQALHAKLAALYHDPFHAAFAQWIESRRKVRPDQPIHHFDCHSMPSQGTKSHADPGGERADVVLSDFEGKSCTPLMLKITKEEFERQGLKVAVNVPYKGGRITQRYGRPLSGHETLQIELNRKLYMNETTKAKLPAFAKFQFTLLDVFTAILERLPRV